MTDRGDRSVRAGALPAAWNTAPARRGPGEFLSETVSDLRDLAVGWRWGRRRLTPGGASTGPVVAARQWSPTDWPQRIPTDWPRRLPVRMLRRALHAIAVRPLLHAEVQLDIGGLEEVVSLRGPVVLVANHASHLDTPLVLEALPGARRRRTGVAVTGDYFFDSGWRAGASAAAFNTFAQTVPGSGPSRTPGELLSAGWSVLIFPEGIRSSDGYVGTFAPDGAALAIEHGVPVLPVGIRGSFAAMPRGRAWPSRQTGPAGRVRSRVSVRFGPAMTVTGDESAEAFTDRIRTAVRGLIAEDEGTWWQSQQALYERSSDRRTEEDRKSTRQNSSH